MNCGKESKMNGIRLLAHKYFSIDCPKTKKENRTNKKGITDLEKDICVKSCKQLGQTDLDSKL
jgi:hypothetical protein